MQQVAPVLLLVSVAVTLSGCGESAWDENEGVIVVIGDGVPTCGANGRCKCPDGQSVIGSAEACGDGSSQYFNADEVDGTDCRCAQNLECPALTTQQDFNLTEYIAKPWFIQQQMETEYLPVSKNYCVNAVYTKRPSSSSLGYTISVRNRAYGVDGSELDSGDDFLMAYGYDSEDPAKLAVAPWFIPKWFSGEYWILAHNETAGYSLISGGEPTLSTPLGCRTGSGTNDAGLWIFSRDPQPDWSLIETVREIAKGQGFDLSVLNNVSHANCTGRPNYPTE